MDRGSAEAIGHLRYGVVDAHVSNSRPRVLDTWLVTLREARHVGRVVDLLGGVPAGSHDNGQAQYVITDAQEVGILLGGPQDLDIGWHRQLGHACDGSSQRDRRGRRPCACPLDLVDRKAATRAGGGCRPRVWLWFRLLDDRELGTFSFASGNWAFVEEVSNALASPRGNHGPTCARLSLQRTPHRLRSGSTITYTRPALVLARAGALEGRDDQAVGSSPPISGSPWSGGHPIEV
jgi:hypothetical protein